MTVTYLPWSVPSAIKCQYSPVFIMIPGQCQPPVKNMLFTPLSNRPIRGHYGTPERIGLDWRVTSGDNGRNMESPYLLQSAPLVTQPVTYPSSHLSRRRPARWADDEVRRGDTRTVHMPFRYASFYETMRYGLEWHESGPYFLNIYNIRFFSYFWELEQLGLRENVEEMLIIAGCPILYLLMSAYRSLPVVTSESGICYLSYLRFSHLSPRLDDTTWTEVRNP